MNTLKYSKINNLILVLLTAAFAFSGCNKKDGPIKEEVNSQILEVPAMSTAVNADGSQAIDLLNLASFSGKFTVTRFFPNSAPPDKVDVVVRKTNSSGTTVKVFKADVTTFPASYTVTANDLTALFGAIALGDIYDFGPDIYFKGQKFEAFPAGGIGTGPGGPKNAPGYSEFARFSAICAYDPNIYKGNFVVVSDGWGDYSAGDVVPITQVSASSFSFIYPADNPKPIIVKVNTGNNVTSVTKQVFGDGYGGASWPYGPISCESVASNDNFVAPCSQTFSVRMQFTVAAGSFGSYTIVMKKQ